MKVSEQVAGREEQIRCLTNCRAATIAKVRDFVDSWERGADHLPQCRVAAIRPLKDLLVFIKEEKNNG